MNGRLRLSFSGGSRGVQSAVAAIAVLLTATPVALVVAAGSAGADPVSAVTSVQAATDGVETVVVHSASMDRDITLRVIRAPAAGAPTLYLLNGAAGGEGGSSWFDQTDIRQFFADKNVNVVVPDGGAASYYTDWLQDDSALGRNKWNTFLAQELPPLINDRLGANGVNAVAGISMAGTSVMQLAIANPGVYRSIGSYSGCARTSDPVGQAFVRSVVEGRGHGNAVNMWGPYDSAAWAANDPYVQAEKLRGTAIYLSSGSGAPGPYDVIGAPGIGNDYKKLAEQIAVGAVIEAATDTCSHQMQARLTTLNIPATYNFRPTGTHSWQYWQSDMHDSWKVIGPSLGLAAG